MGYDHSRLRSPPPSPQALRDAIRPVADAAGYRLVVLFGSVARGEPSPGDIDLAVLGPAPLDVVDAAAGLARALGTGAVDVVDLRRAGPVLLMAVARDGVPLFEATGSELAELASLAMRRYADTKKFRDAVRDDLREYTAAMRKPE